MRSATYSRLIMFKCSSVAAKDASRFFLGIIEERTVRGKKQKQQKTETRDA